MDLLAPALQLAVVIVLLLILKEIKKTMSTTAEIQASIDASTAKVTAMTSVLQSATAAITGIPARIADELTKWQAANPGVDVSALTAAVDAESANADDLAKAITANTPAAKTP